MESRKSLHSEMTFGGTGHSQKMWVFPLLTINEELSSCMYLPSHNILGFICNWKGDRSISPYFHSLIRFVKQKERNAQGFCWVYGTRNNMIWLVATLVGFKIQ